ncbi:protein still life, isoform SIF type 1-like, partial [Dendroctonus ponderosae]
MGNKLSCSCAPLIKKAYRYDESPWQTSRRRDGHLLRLWAEVFYATAASEAKGQFFWQQLSDDLVPVNITCIQDSPEYVFHITAYNSQVDRIVDVRMVQPGTRIGTANECFIYWRDPITNDTWGLNFTSSIDCKQFRECVFPAFKFSRKASSSYSLKLDPPTKHKLKAKRKPLSTPASPSRGPREPQCTCMTAEQMAKLRAQDPRYRGSSTLPRAAKISDTEGKIATAASSTSLYDNLGATQTSSLPGTKSGHRNGSQTKQSRNVQSQSDSSGAAPASAGAPQAPKTVTASVGTENDTETQGNQTESQSQTSDQQQSESVQVGEPLAKATSSGKPSLKEKGHHMLSSAKSVDYSDMEMNRNREFRGGHGHNSVSNNIQSRKNKSKSSEDMNRENGISLDSNTLKRMLKPMPSQESPVTSPEMSRKRYHYHNHPGRHVNNSRHSDPEARGSSINSRFSGSRSSHEIGRGYPGRGLYLELERGAAGDFSPPSDNVIFDNQCYATTPSSSNGNSDMEQAAQHYGRRRLHRQNSSVNSTPGSPTSRLLLEYEMHLRNTLAKGMDAESYSLHTFEALLTQSMENLEFAESLPGSNTRSPYHARKRPTSSASMRSSTLPYNQRMGVRERERDGYYSDRNELSREREKERERGYLSDHNANSRCASCIGESSRAQWFRHSDGWRSGSSAYGSAQGGVLPGHRRAPWDSLPSLRQESSMNDSGYKSNPGDSFEQRGLFDRQDSLRSDYMSDRESCRYGIVQQASIESADSRLCYLTSSEISDDDRMS